MVRKQLNLSKIKSLIILMLWLTSHSIFAQFAPQAGFETSTAIYKDSTILVAWATECKVVRGYIDIADTSKTDNGSNKASFGTPEMATGKADGTMNVVSLGDGGMAVLKFPVTISDGPGPDFAVFENGFMQNSDENSAFLELAFVEVSTDSVHFVRFPSVSLTPSSAQIGTFEPLDAKKLHNLAGKYIAGYGTPFDLAELADSPFVDIHNINYIRIIDVIGTTDSSFASYDSQNNIINDPYPTPFASGGFDLDAVGVINTKHADASNDFTLYPNPASNFIFIKSKNYSDFIVNIFSITGKKILSKKSFTYVLGIDITPLQKGIYLAYIQINTKTKTVSFIKN